MKTKILRFWAEHEKQVALAALALAALYPLAARTGYLMNIGTLCCMYGVLALSLNFISGNLGIITLGHAAFFGIGAYTSAILSTNFGWDFLVTLPAALVVSCLFGILIGLPTLRLTGKYLSIVTLSFCEICRILEVNLDWLTRGPRGITNIPPHTVFGVKLSGRVARYYVILVILVICALFLGQIMKTKIGRGILAIKNDEIAAEAMGINVYRYKIMTFAISAMVAGAAGAYYAHYARFIDPTTFSSSTSTTILSMVILGGLGSPTGAILGAALITILLEALRSFMELRMVIYGILIILLIVFRPQGILGGFNLKYIRQQNKFEKERADP